MASSVEAGNKYLDRDQQPLSPKGGLWDGAALEVAKIVHRWATGEPRVEPPYKPGRREFFAVGGVGGVVTVAWLASRFWHGQEGSYPITVADSVGSKQVLPNPGVAASAPDAGGSKDQPVPTPVGLDYEGSKGHAALGPYGLNPSGFENYSVVGFNALARLDVDFTNLSKLNAGQLPIVISDNSPVLLVLTSREVVTETGKRDLIKQVESDPAYKQFLDKYHQSRTGESFDPIKVVVNLPEEIRKIYPQCSNLTQALRTEGYDKISRFLSLAVLQEIQIEAARTTGVNRSVVESQVEAWMSGLPKELLPIRVKDVEPGLPIQTYLQSCIP